MMLTAHRFKNMCDNRNSTHLEILQKSRFLIDVPLKFILFSLLILSTEDLFEEKRTVFWYAHIQFSGWYDNILDLKMVSILSCIFYIFVKIKTLIQPELYRDNILNGGIKLLFDISSLYFQTSAFILSLLYLEFYGLIIISIIFAILLGVTREETGCFFQCITMVLNPFNTICQSSKMDFICEISKITLHCLNVIISLVVINGDYSWKYDKWTVLSNMQANIIMSSLIVHALFNLLSYLTKEAYKKFSITINLCSLIMIIIVMFHVVKFGSDVNKENIYISYLKQPNNSVTIISKGK